MTSNATLEPATNLAVSLWVRTTAIEGTLVEKGDAGCDLPSWKLALYDGSVNFQWRSESAYGSRGAPQDSRINDGSWHHVALSMAIPTGEVTLYVDGRTSDSGSGPALGIDYDAAALSTTDLIVGSLGTCDTAPSAVGDIDDLRFYAAQLSAADIWAMEPAYATTTTLEMDPAVPVAGEETRLFARIQPYPPNAGTIKFHYTVNGGPDQVLESPVSVIGSGLLEFGGGNPLPLGHYVFQAVYDGVGPAQPSTSNQIEFTISPYPTSTSLTGAWTQLPAEPFQLSAATTFVTPRQGASPSGPLTLYDITGQDPVEVTTVGGCHWQSQPGTCNAFFQVPGLAIGTYKLRAHFEGSGFVASSDSPVFDLVVAKGTPTITISASPNPVQAHHPSYVTATRYAPGALNQPTDGVLLIRDLATGNVLSTSNPGGSWLQVEVPTAALGTHQFAAEWSGNAQFTSGSATTTLQIVSDVLEATGVGINSATFYPVVDGYRDTVSARGTRSEPISVAITIKNSSGSIVRKASIARASGAYSWAWNGKNTAGTLLPAGTYRIYQVLKDAAGTTKTVASSVTLSRKKLYWYTTDLYRSASQYQKKTSSWGAWLFTMPSATSYRYLRLYVDGRTTGWGSYGAHDRRQCSWSTFGPGCASHAGALGLFTGWSSIRLNDTYDRNGRYVRSYVWAEYGSVSVLKLRLHLQYGILK
jgi:hypothetical protein